MGAEVGLDKNTVGRTGIYACGECVRRTTLALLESMLFSWKQEAPASISGEYVHYPRKCLLHTEDRRIDMKEIPLEKLQEIIAMRNEAKQALHSVAEVGEYHKLLGEIRALDKVCKVLGMG